MVSSHKSRHQLNLLVHMVAWWHVWYMMLHFPCKAQFFFDFPRSTFQSGCLVRETKWFLILQINMSWNSPSYRTLASESDRGYSAVKCFYFIDIFFFQFGRSPKLGRPRNSPATTHVRRKLPLSKYDEDDGQVRSSWLKASCPNSGFLLSFWKSWIDLFEFFSFPNMARNTELVWKKRNPMS